MEYKYPTFIADGGLKRLHAVLLDSVFENAEETCRKCDIGRDTRVVDFVEAIRLFSEEAFRTCGNCLMAGGEVSNWKERAERAEADVRGLNSQLNQSDKLAADWKERAEAAETQNRRLRLSGEGQ